MQETQAGRAASAVQFDMAGALAGIARAVLGEELAAIRESVSALQDSLHKRMDSLAREQATAAEALRKEMTESMEKISRNLAGSEKTQTDALAEIQGRLLKTGGDLERKLAAQTAEFEKKLGQAGEAIKTEIVIMHDSIKEEQAEFQQQAIQQFQYVEGRLGAGAQDLAALQKDHARLSSVLANFGRAFTGGIAAPEELSVTDSAPTPSPAPAPAAPQAPQPSEVPTVSPPGASRAPAAGNALPGSDDIEQGFDELFRTK